jgi:uncharacterized protein YjbJ (UPF0337 family)
MNATDKAKNEADRIKGKGKEAAGKAVGNERLEEEGKVDQVKGGLKQAGEKVKDTGKKVEGKVKDTGKKVEGKVKDTGKKVEDTVKGVTKD